ncbi:MAG TPA: selenocysteine-specific translation elongation factor [Candidatus Limnocylindrales bacterium]
MTVVIGTAGHIDHGKTTLLRALTGIEADRLPEERARGMTIDVGYAHLALGDGTELDFVDVPGHDRLVGNMLVGAGEIDAALLVVAADDGVRAQTIEHVRLLDALAIGQGVAVVTKSDVAPADRVEEVVGSTRELLATTSLREVPVFRVSATTGAGLEELRAGLVAVRNQVAPAADGLPRLAVDRVFTIRGRGTVVTGTLRSGRVERGGLLRVVPGEAGDAVRVREVQVHGRTVESAGPGRVALNVAGQPVQRLARGVVLTTDPAVVASDRWLVTIRSATRLPADRARVSVHLGTAQVPGVVGRSGRDALDLAPDEGTAVLRLAEPIAVAPGARFALRRPSPAEPLGGGRVIDVHPPRGTARRRTTPERLRALAAAPPGSAGWRDARLDLHGAVTSPTPALAADVVEVVDAAIVAAAGPATRRPDLLRAGARELRRHVGSIDHPGVAARLDELVADGSLVRDGDRIRPPGVASPAPDPATLAAMDRLEALLAVVAPPALSEAARAVGCPAEGIRALEQANRIVRVDDGLAWAFATYRDLAGRALAMASVAPLTPAAYRDATGTSRKYVMAILEDLDRRAILRRTPEGHVPGPRASQLAPAGGG